MSLSKLIEAVEAGMDPGLYYHVPQSLAEHAEIICAAHYGSLDAAKRLHDALLPGWDWSVGTSNGICSASVSKIGLNDSFEFVQGYDGARCLLLAILRALEQEGRNG